MKAKNLIILIVIAAILCGWAYVSSSRKGRLTKAATLIGKPVLAALQDAETLNGIDRIVFLTAQGTVTVAKVEGTWVSPAKYNYPVKFDTVRNFLRTLADLKVGQSLSSERKEDLNLVSPESATAEDAGKTGTLVKLKTDSSGGVCSLLVGKEHTRQAPEDSPYGRGMGAYPDGRFVAAEGQVCLVSEALSDIPGDAKAWLETRIANVSSSDMTDLTVTDSEGRTLTLVRAEGKSDLVLPDLADDEEMDSVKVSGLASVMSWLNFDDIVDPATPEADLGFDKATVVTAATKDGKVYTLTLGAGPEGSESRYARLNAEYEPPADEERPVAVEPETGEAEAGASEADNVEADAAAKQAKEEEQKKLADETKAFNDTVAGWTYVLLGQEIKDIAVERANLLKAVEKDDEEEEAAAVPAAPVIEPEPPVAEPTPEPAPEAIVPVETPEAAEPVVETQPDPEAAPPPPVEALEPETRPEDK